LLLKSPMMIKSTALLVSTLFLSVSLLAQQYKPLEDSSSVTFKIKNFGIPVSGTIKGIKGTIQFDPQKLGSAAFNVTLETSTINTGIEMRDSHLKKEDYLNATQYPEITFTSTKVSPSTKDGYLFIFGNLSIKGVTKPISFPFQALPNGDGYTFVGSFTINRRDYEVGGSSISMSDQVSIELKIAAK